MNDKWLSDDKRHWDFFDNPRYKNNTGTNPRANPINNPLTEYKDEHEAEPKGIRETKIKGKRGTVQKSSPITKPRMESKRKKSSASVLAVICDIKKSLADMGFNELVREVEKIERGLNNERFRISVVGEFSRGKSTFINRLFGRDLLPVGNLPTTAVLTKITYNESEMLVFVDSTGKKKAMPLAADSWEGLTARDNAPDPQGVAFVGLNSPWLAKTGIEIVDTPGAGDLHDKRRSLLVNDALLCGDGAIITISANAALSQSERSFMEQRLFATKIPCLALIVTRMDILEPRDRPRIMQYIKEKLSLWDMEIPVFIPQDDMEIPDADYSEYIGIEAIKGEMEKWVTDSEHFKKKRASVCAQLLSIIEIARISIEERIELLNLNKQKRREALELRREQLSNSHVQWEDLRSEIMRRGNKCYEWLMNNVSEKTEALVERLQYEASHSASPQKWWEEDYPYRLKVEMMNLAATLESGLSQIYSNDLNWLNDELDKKYRQRLTNVGKKVIADKTIFRDTISTSEVVFEDLEKKRTIVRIGTGAATIAGFALLAASGLMPIIASIAIGTGSTIISEKVFRQKIEEQQHVIRETIAKDIPHVIDNALMVSEQRLKEAYHHITMAIVDQEEIWFKSQMEALETLNNVEGEESKESGAKVQMNNILNIINRINHLEEPM